MKKTTSKALCSALHALVCALFVLAPLVLIFGQSFSTLKASLVKTTNLLASKKLSLSQNELQLCALCGRIVTLVTLLISYPTVLFLTRLKSTVSSETMLIILPTWINLLLKAYTFIGILVRISINQFWICRNRFATVALYRFLLYLKLHRASLYDFTDFQCLGWHG